VTTTTAATELAAPQTPRRGTLPRRPRVVIIGAGKVGRTLAAALRRAHLPTKLVAVRRGLPAVRWHLDVLIIAARESEFSNIIDHFASGQWLPADAVVLHVAGSLSSAVLAPLRPVTGGVAQFHPLLAFADARHPPDLRGAHVNVEGDPRAVALARKLATRLGLRPRTLPGLDPIAYHAAAGLLANGAAALAAASQRILTASGLPTKTASALLGPLLRSVADNVESLGMPAALTGPVRRGDAIAVAKHRQILERIAPELLGLFNELARAQLGAAHHLRDATPQDLAAIEALLP
jgi:predicted short-subunit dehydrogenase-like oxidoreductase (DUF2520 family)